MSPGRSGGSRHREGIAGLIRNLFVKGADDFELGSGGSMRRYRVLQRYTVASTLFVSLAPLTIITFISYDQYEEAFRAQLIGPVARITGHTQQSVEFFLAERRSALQLIAEERTCEELSEAGQLRRVFRDLSSAFGGFVDLGLIDAAGKQRSYEGPYELLGKDYGEQDWFHEVRLRGIHVSEVFMGYRGFPHFVIAVKHVGEDGEWHVLRATVDSEELVKRILSKGLHPLDDVFLVNREGVLQTPSRLYGKILRRVPLPLLVLETEASVLESADADGEPLIVGRATIAQSPFVLFLIKRQREALAGWETLRGELLLFFSLSVVLIVAVVWVASTYMVRRIREADHRRAAVLHKAEYTNRMATIGRLAAGVAHEINNPLAIINEKAGLVQDLLAAEEDFPRRQRLLDQADSIIRSVARASTVTHRLLGFARHMDVRTEPIAIEGLIREVLGFLEKEATHRNIQLLVQSPDDLPTIESDRGQLQQVFLNIINNALSAVEDGGRIEITLKQHADRGVSVTITDNGCGIEPENLSRIFEPFFTTRKGAGTGLGLSITYGIVEKLGGALSVDSEVGQWTRFTVVLPLQGPGPEGGA